MLIFLIVALACCLPIVKVEANTKPSSLTSTASAEFDGFALTKQEQKLLERLLVHRHDVQEILNGDRIWPARIYDRGKKMFEDTPREDQPILSYLIHSNSIVREPGIEPIDIVKSTTSKSHLLNQIPNDPSAFELDAKSTNEFHEKVDQLFRQGHYQEAFPLLLASAKYGYRNSQSRLAFILFQDLEGLPRDDVRAFAWLGTAASTSKPRLESLYGELHSRLNDENKQAVDSVVEVYRKRFGVVKPFDCDTIDSDSSTLKRIYCHLQLDAAIKNCGKPCAL